MKYYFWLVQILLVFAGMKDIDACCWRSKLDDTDDPNKNSTLLALHKHSDSTCSNSSDGSFSRIYESSSQKKRSDSFSVFDVYEGNFSQEVIATTEISLLSRYNFNKKSAACFIWLKGGLIISFDYEYPLEKTAHVRRHALNFLNEKDFFPQNYSQQSKQSLVHALQFFLQKRYALLNYCMKIILDQPTGTSEFFSIFAEKSSITQKFSENLANYFLQNPATQCLPALEKIFSQHLVWTTIITAFSSYPTKRSYLERFSRALGR